jgi:hypothetical protein
VFYILMNSVYFITRNFNDEALEGYNRAGHLEIHVNSHCLVYNIQNRTPLNAALRGLATFPYFDVFSL